MSQVDCNNALNLIRLANEKQIPIPRNPKKRDLCTLLNQLDDPEHAENVERLKKRFLDEKTKEESKSTNIVNQYLVKVKERAKNDKTWLRLGETNGLKLFVDADPTETKSYLIWILQSYVDGGIKLLEDLSRTKVALQKYIELRPRLTAEEKQLGNYCGIAGCEKRSVKKPGLEDLIDKYTKSTKETLKDEKTRQITIEGKVENVTSDDFDVIYDGETLRLIIPKTKAAACYYGQGTRWCTAATKGANVFDDYSKDEPLFIMLPKKPRYVEEKYQFSFVNDQYMNDKDEKVEFSKLLHWYPELTKTQVYIYYLIKEQRDNEAENMIKTLGLPEDFYGGFIYVLNGDRAFQRKDKNAIINIFQDARVPIIAKNKLKDKHRFDKYFNEILPDILKVWDDKTKIALVVESILDEKFDRFYLSVVESIKPEYFATISLDDLQTILGEVTKGNILTEDEEISLIEKIVRDINFETISKILANLYNKVKTGNNSKSVAFLGNDLLTICSKRAHNGEIDRSDCQKLWQTWHAR